MQNFQRRGSYLGKSGPKLKGKGGKGEKLGRIVLFFTIYVAFGPRGSLSPL